MADLQISQLSTVSPTDLAMTDLLVVVNDNTTKNVHLSSLLAASSAFYVPYIVSNIVPVITLVTTAFPLWNAAYTTVSTLSSDWLNHTINQNLIVGSNTPLSSTPGQLNVALGESSLALASSGSGNIAIGYQTLFLTTSGSGNTAVGYNAGYSNVIGNNNTYIGNQATGNCPDESNTINLGNGAIKTLRCQAGTITSLSDRRDKQNINPISNSLNFVAKLNPVSFVWNTRDKQKVGQFDVGFIAQELQQAQIDTDYFVPGLVNDENPDVLEASYSKLIPTLVKSIQELSLKVQALELQLNNKS